MRQSNRLPNFQNLGIHLRIILITNAALVMSTVLLSANFRIFADKFLAISAFAQPMLLLSLLMLYLSYGLLKKLRYWPSLNISTLLVLLSCFLIHTTFSQVFIFNALPSLITLCSYVLLLCIVIMYYFNLHYRAYSPAVVEARLQALQARIRPHFLFNSINAVLSLIRSQPKQAEIALEDMADLFRVLMADNRELAPLAQEISLCRQYLALEKLRLGERLSIIWQIDDMPQDALVPPLVLQPLLENAVYHGIEPLADGGAIRIHIYNLHREVHIVISNPFTSASQHHQGNKMALNNIKERLTLHFDFEASIKSKQQASEYQVHIMLPHTTQTY
jgi:two-component system, LytTR family, sensor histidine kinase AlgZ